MLGWFFEVLWIASTLFTAILTARIWSIARDARRIADALESATLRSLPRADRTNEVRDYLE